MFSEFSDSVSVFLFYPLSTSEGYLMSKPFLQEKRIGTILRLAEGMRVYIPS